VSCLGVYIALNAEQEQDVWTHFYDETILDLAGALRADHDEEHRQRTDKAWDPIHRCLSDGTLVWDAGRWPLRGAILGRMVPRPAPRAARPRVRGRRRPGRLRLHLVLVRTDARVLPQDRRRGACDALHRGPVTGSWVSR